MAEKRFNPDEWYEIDDKGNKTFDPFAGSIVDLSKDDYGKVLDLFDKEIDYTQTEPNMSIDHYVVNHLKTIYNSSDNEEIKTRALEKFQSYIDSVDRATGNEIENKGLHERRFVDFTNAFLLSLNLPEFEDKFNALVDKYYAKAMEDAEFYQDFEKYMTSNETSQKYFEEAQKRYEESHAQSQPQENQDTQEIPDKTPEERAEARLSKVPTDEFKAFMEQEYGAGSFEKHYVNAPAEEKDRLEAQFEAKFKKEPLKDPKEVKINEGENDNTNTNQQEPQDEDWKEKRIKAWKAYAQEHQQEFGLTSDAQAADLGLKVGDTAIHYQDESNVTMGNGEYEKFVKLVQIEKENNTDIINFGNINSEEYKAKLAAACIQQGMDFKNGPEHIDLALDCFKNIDDATRAKIEAYNKKKEEEKRTQDPKTKTEEKDNQPEQNQEPQRDKEYYKKLYDEKLKEFQEQKTTEVDLSNVKDAGERAVIYAAAKDKSVMAKVQGADKEKFVTEETKEAVSTLPPDMQTKLKMHDSNVDKFAKMKQSHAQTQEEVAAMDKGGKAAASERISSNILNNYYHNNQGR